MNNAIYDSVNNEAFTGIINSNQIMTDDFLLSSDIKRILEVNRLIDRHGSNFKYISHMRKDEDKIEIYRFAIPVSLISSYVIIEFANKLFGARFQQSVIETASVTPLIQMSRTEEYDFIVVSTSFLLTYRNHVELSAYVAVYALGTGSHGVILPKFRPTEPDLFRENKNHILCVGRNTPQRFLRSMEDIGLLDKKKTMSEYTDPGNGTSLRSCIEALKNDASVAAFFPMTALLESLDVGNRLGIETLDISRAAHILMARKDRFVDSQRLEKILSIIEFSRRYLSSNHHQLRLFLKEVLGREGFVSAFSECIRH